MRKKLIFILLVAALFCLMAGFMVVVVAAETNTVTADLIDPITLTRGERASDTDQDRTLIIETASSDEIADKVIVYTGRFYYMDSYVRTGAVEYAVAITEQGHQIVTKYEPIAQGAEQGNEIPVPGYLLSIPASKAESCDFAEGDIITISNAGDIPSVSQTVDNLTKRVRVEIQNLNAATNTYAGSVYYGNDYGDVTGQNSYNREVGFSLLTTGDDVGKFRVTEYRQLLADTRQEWVNGESSDVAWNRDFPIPDPGFALIAANVEDYDDPYVHAVFGMLNRDVAFSLGDLVELSGKQFFDFEYEVTHSYDYLNPGPENVLGQGYPENRGAEQMMIYTHSVEDGSSELKTNEYGFEAAVDQNGVIVKIAVNVIDIPEGGFVVSAQGLLRDWARTYFKMGATVTYNEQNKTFTVNYTLNAMKSQLETDLSTYRTEVEVYKNGLYDLDTTNLESYLEELTETGERMVEVIDYIQAHPDLAGEELLEQQIELRNLRDEFEAIKVNMSVSSVESRVVEGRGVWHVPNVDGTETSLAGIRGVLDVFENMNLNMIFLEGYYAGYTHSVSQYVPQNPYTKAYDYSGTEADEQYGNDYFKAFVTEAKKRGFEVHVSITVYYMSRTDRWVDEPDRLATVHPEWVNVSNEGYTATSDGHQAIFADPANDAYHDMLVNYVTELFTLYPEVDGINLDYIRYPDKSSAGREFGYTMASVQKFLDTYGYTFRGDDNPDEAQLRADFDKFISSDASIDAQWDNFRRSLVTQMVVDLRDAMRAVKPGGLVSIATGPSPDESKNNLYQDWGQWVRSGIIDLCTPMAYYTDADVVENIAGQEITIINNLAYNYVGLGPYLKLAPNEWVNQISAAQSAGAMGYALFSSEQVLTDPDAVALVTQTANKNEAVVPHAATSVILDAFFTSILEKADKYYLPNNSMTQTQYDSLAAVFADIQAMPDTTAKELYAIYERVQNLISDVDDYVSFYAESRLRSDLNLLSSNLNIKVGRALVESGQWNPSVNLARPILSEGQANRIVWQTQQSAPEETEDWTAFGIALAGMVILNAALAGCIVVLNKKKRRNET